MLPKRKGKKKLIDRGKIRDDQQPGKQETMMWHTKAHIFEERSKRIKEERAPKERTR